MSAGSYLDGNTIVIKENGITKNYLAFTDNIGSILSVIDENGAKVFDASYDAWGRQTVKLNTIHHVDVVYRGTWASHAYYSNYYGRSPYEYEYKSNIFH